MIEEQNQVILEDQRGKTPVKFDLNFSSEAKDCVKVTMGDQVSFLKIADLYGMIFVICSPDQQDNLMPVRQTTIRKLVRWHTVTVKKSLKPGDTLTVKCETDVPVTVEEGLRGSIFKRRLNQTKIAIP